MSKNGRGGYLPGGVQVRTTRLTASAWPNDGTAPRDPQRRLEQIWPYNSQDATVAPHHYIWQGTCLGGTLPTGSGCPLNGPLGSQDRSRLILGKSHVSAPLRKQLTPFLRWVGRRPICISQPPSAMRLPGPDWPTVPCFNEAV